MKTMTVKLRNLQNKDCQGMLEWMHDHEVSQYFRDDMEGKDERDVMEFIAHAETIPLEGKSIHYAISDENDEYLGTISLKNIDLVVKKAEYAISLRRQAQGKGIAVQATHMVLQLAFEKYGMERIYLNVLSDNERAIHLYEKCGFVYEGEFRKHLFLRGEYKTLKWYSMLKEEYFAMCGNPVWDNWGGGYRAHLYSSKAIILYVANKQYI